jgi:hypothetical protein
MNLIIKVLTVIILTLQMLKSGHSQNIILLSENNTANHDLTRALVEVEISNSLSRISVSGNNIVGGAVGKIQGKAGLYNIYATGLITGIESFNNGLIGDISEPVTIQNSYWDTQSTEQNSSAGGAGRLTSQMTYPYAAGTYTNWDFTNVWAPDVNGINNGYPYLRNQIPVNFELIVESENSDKGSVSGSGKFATYTRSRIKAVPKAEHVFSHWYDVSSQSVISDEADYIFAMSNENTRLRAYFETALYQMTVNIDPPGSGSVSGTGSFANGSPVSLTAMANPGFAFVSWTDDIGQIISTANPYAFNMPGTSFNITANFKDISSTQESYLHNIRIYPNPFTGCLHFENGNEITQVTIFSITGIPLINLHSVAAIHSIDGNNIPPGIYLVQIFTKTGNKLFKAVKN